MQVVIKEGDDGKGGQRSRGHGAGDPVGTGPIDDAVDHYHLAVKPHEGADAQVAVTQQLFDGSLAVVAPRRKGVDRRDLKNGVAGTVKPGAAGDDENETDYGDKRAKETGGIHGFSPNNRPAGCRVSILYGDSVAGWRRRVDRFQHGGGRPNRNGRNFGGAIRSVGL